MMEESKHDYAVRGHARIGAVRTIMIAEQLDYTDASAILFKLLDIENYYSLAKAQRNSDLNVDSIVRSLAGPHGLTIYKMLVLQQKEKQIPVENG